MIVMKFGGTSLADAEHVRRAATIIARARDDGPVVVASAMAGVTDRLHDAAARAAASDLDGARHAVGLLRELHLDTLATLANGTRELAKATARVTACLDHLAHTLEALALVETSPPRALDAVMATGEDLSTAVLEIALQEAGVPVAPIDARDVIITDATFGRATPDLERIRELAQIRVAPVVASRRIPLLQGYVGATRDRITTTVGRGGSDFTAALLGAALPAERVEIWTDVHGLMTADPRVVPSARPLAEATYDEAAELAHFGAKVLHPATMAPVIHASIPLWIRNSRDPSAPGTRISAEPGRQPGSVKSIASKRGVTTISLQAPRMLGAHGFLRNVLDRVEAHGVAVDVVATSEVSVSFTIERGVAGADLLDDLAQLGEVQVDHDRAIICVVGEALRETPGIAARIFKAVTPVNVQMISMGASKINMTLVVRDAEAADAVTRLHAEFFPD